MSVDEHLSRIETSWSVIWRANTPEGTSAAAAQEQLPERYGGAIRRYLHACLRDRDAADEVFQEFSLRFVRGNFRGADPTESERRESSNFGNKLFLSRWRDKLLAKTWSSLEERERKSGSAYDTTLRLRIKEPDLRSAQLAERLTQRLSKPMTAEGGRVLIHRARDRVAEFLISAVAESIDGDSPDAIAVELIDLQVARRLSRDVAETTEEIMLGRRSINTSRERR